MCGGHDSFNPESLPPPWELQKGVLSPSLCLLLEGFLGVTRDSWARHRVRAVAKAEGHR